MKKVLAAVFLGLVFAVSAAAQDLPNLEKFELVGLTKDDTAFLVSEVLRSKSDLMFALLMADAQVDEAGVHLNKNQWALFAMKADCREMTYQIEAMRGVSKGVPYTENKKSPKQKPDPRSNIGHVLSVLCNDKVKSSSLDS